MAPPTPYMSNLPPYAPPMDNYRFPPKPERLAYEGPEALYMLQRESTENPQWDMNFERLREFYLSHGHCRVSKVTDPALFAWCSNQRYLTFAIRN